MRSSLLRLLFRPILGAALVAATGAVAPAQVIGLSQLHSSTFTPDEVADAGTSFGEVLAVVGDRMLVATPSIDQVVGTVVAARVGGARILERDSEGDWNTVAVLTPVGLSSTSLAGRACAFSGERAVLGAPFANTFGDDRGAVVIFDRATDGTWAQTALIAPPVPGSAGGFGSSVALDGDRLLIGEEEAGAAYVYERGAGGTWSVSSVLEVPFLSSGADFGREAVLSGDRAWVSGSGPVYAFARVGPDWVLTSEIASVDAPTSLAFDAASGTLLVGQPQADLYGAVDLFAPTSPTTWDHVQRLTVNAYEDGFGHSLALHGDRLLVGLFSTTSSVTQRRAFLFEREPGGPWAKALELHGDAYTNNVSFGLSVALSEDSAHVGVATATTSFPNGVVATFDLGTLRSSGRHLSTVEGRDQRLFLRSGEEHAWHWFVIAGSASGVGAGTALPGSSLVLPLTLDAYSFAILDGSATNLTFWFGPLDANGNANVDFRVPPLEYVPYIGGVLHHAYFVIDPVTFAIDHVSNAVPLELVP